ncbi:MAG: sigma-70 family RNA polymerase sigma factor [Flavobacteriales bacterium]|jgi:RNA polymerase sigma-70 factor, ECF subfamily|nr:sigma-70 family RNA polymerase sigma factor [Flavobacteriales bacterium]
MATDKLADQQLIRNYLEGNDYSFEILLKRHQDRVFNYINKLVKNNDVANDVFQDTFIKVISTLKRGMYNEEGKFLPWVMRIAHNLVIDYFRNSSKMPIVGRKNNSDSDEFDIFQILKLEDCTVEDEIVEGQIHEDLRALVDLLPQEQREVVKMRHFMGMSFKDIADSSDVSINTALGRMRYALINLRKMIKENDIMLTVS